jgi:uncharacterized protein
MSTETNPPSLLSRLLGRFFPKMPDFFGMLTEQCRQVCKTTGLLVEFMETANHDIGKQIRKDEHEADRVKIHNLHTLNEAFSTPIDREDLYRAIMDLDEVVNYCKTTVSEMEVLGLQPDKHCLEMAMHIKLGSDALLQGFGRLATSPGEAAADADAAARPNAGSKKPIGGQLPTSSRATTTSTCSSSAKSIATWPMPPTAWRIAPIHCTTLSSRCAETTHEEPLPSHPRAAGLDPGGHA